MSSSNFSEVSIRAPRMGWLIMEDRAWLLPLNINGNKQPQTSKYLLRMYELFFTGVEMSREGFCRRIMGRERCYLGVVLGF